MSTIPKTNLTDEEVAKILEKYQDVNPDDKNETYTPDTIDIIEVSEEDLKQSQEDSNNEEYDIFDVEEDWEG